MAEADVQYVYTLFVAGTHLFFAVMVLRLFQLAKIKKLCKDTFILRLAVILVVTSTLTLASIPISTSNPVEQALLSNQAMLWSIARTTGLLILSFIMLVSFLKRSTWDGRERRTGRTDRIPLEGMTHQ